MSAAYHHAMLDSGPSFPPCIVAHRQRVALRCHNPLVRFGLGKQPSGRRQDRTGWLWTEAICISGCYDPSGGFAEWQLFFHDIAKLTPYVNDPLPSSLGSIYKYTL